MSCALHTAKFGTGLKRTGMVSLASMEAKMANLLVRDLSPELEAAIQEFATRRDISLSAAALELLQAGVDSEFGNSESSNGLPVGDFVVETLKEVFHTKDQAEEFIHNQEDPLRRPTE